MRNLNPILLFVILIPLLSCDNISRQEIHFQSDSEEITELFKAFLDKQKQIKLLKYDVQRTDTFVNGNIRKVTAKVVMERDRKDSILGFSFYAQREDVESGDYYSTYTYYEVFHDKKMCMMVPDYGKAVSVTPGGQMLITDLFQLDTRDKEVSLLDPGDENFIVKTKENNGSSITIQLLRIGKKTLLPNQFRIIKIGKEGNLRYSITKAISDVRINEAVKNNPLSDLGFKTKYTRIRSANGRDGDVLIGKKIPKIKFQTFRKGAINIRDLEGQAVLLDFWELWCGPCIKSLPEVELLSNAYETCGLFIIGVVSDDIGEAKNFIEKENIDLVQAGGSVSIKEALKITSFPRYILIDQKGIVRGIYYGYSEMIELDVNDLLLK
jgi:thiol-disulfide isomerase/thioredoxin